MFADIHILYPNVWESHHRIPNQVAAQTPEKASTTIPALQSLSTMWEVQKEFLATNFGPSPTLAVPGIWEIHQQIEHLVVSLALPLSSHLLPFK